MSKPGADAIFPEALQDAEEFRDFAKEVKAPLLANMTEFGKSPLALIAGTFRSRLSHGHFSAERFSRDDEGERGIFAGFERARDAIGVAGKDADAQGTLRIARLRSCNGAVGWLSRAISCSRAEAR